MARRRVMVFKLWKLRTKRGMHSYICFFASYRFAHFNIVTCIDLLGYVIPRLDKTAIRGYVLYMQIICFIFGVVAMLQIILQILRFMFENPFIRYQFCFSLPRQNQQSYLTQLYICQYVIKCRSPWHIVYNIVLME